MKVTSARVASPALVADEDIALVEAHAADDFVHLTHPSEVPAAPLANFNGMVAFSPKRAFRPGSIDEVSRILRGLPAGTKVKAGGSRHSMQAVATNDVYIHPEGMRHYQRLDERHVRVGSGTLLRDLNALLWRDGRALPVMGGYDGQTVAGAFATGTHGSVLERGPMNSLVRSMDVVKADGTKVRIEPTGGITRDAPAGMQLIQDDEVFAAARTSLGTLGVIFSVVIDTEAKFYLLERRRETTLSEALRATAYHVEVAFNPHSGKTVLTTRDKVELAEEPFDMSGRPGRTIVYPDFARPAFAGWMQNRFARSIGGVTNVVSHLAPRRVSALVDASLQTLPDVSYLQRSYNVFHLGDGTQKIPVRFGSLFVPQRHTARAVDVLRRAAAEWYAARGQCQTGPISIRYVKGTDSQLGSREDFTSFEIIFAGAPDYAEAMFDYYRASLEEAFGDDVTFHLGQMLGSVSAADMTRFKGLDTFKRIRRAFDPRGMFLNAHQAHLGL